MLEAYIRGLHAVFDGTVEWRKGEGAERLQTRAENAHFLLICRCVCR